MDLQHFYYKSKIFASPGIGKYYIDRAGNSRYNKFNYDKTNQCYTTRTGHKIKLPKYLRYKIYNEQERESLWIDQMNKEKIYVLGQQIDISKNYDEYLRAIEYARKLNAQLGFGTNKKNWIRELEENKRRDYLLQKRIANAQHNPAYTRLPHNANTQSSEYCSESACYRVLDGGCAAHAQTTIQEKFDIPVNNSIIAHYLNNKNKNNEYYTEIRTEKWYRNYLWDNSELNS